jgi:hypothetical protein
VRLRVSLWRRPVEDTRAVEPPPLDPVPLVRDPTRRRELGLPPLRSEPEPEWQGADPPLPPPKEWIGRNDELGIAWKYANRPHGTTPTPEQDAP